MDRTNHLSIILLLWGVFLPWNCESKKGRDSSAKNLRVQTLSAHSLQISWDPPVLKPGDLLVGYSLVFVPVNSHNKARTYVELFINNHQHVLRKLHPGTRYRIKLAPLINDGKHKGIYTNWVNARTLPVNKDPGAPSQNPNAGLPSSSVVPGHCRRISQHCDSIGYNFTQLPNNFKQKTPQEAESELSQFIPVLKANCSSVLKVFLCSLYLPPCSDDVSKPTPPCRAVCMAAKRECEARIMESWYRWPHKFDCNRFPEPTEKACVGEDGVTTNVVKSKMPSGCEALEVNMCKKFGYEFVKMPNFFQDDTQQEAKQEIEEFGLLVKTNCAPSLHFFLCSLYAPPCVRNQDGDGKGIQLPPCRGLCEEAKRGCERFMRLVGIPWPSAMNCSRFRYVGESKICLAPYKAKNTGPRPPRIQKQPQCEQLRITMCKTVNYTQTTFPNFLNHTNQAEARKALKEIKSLVKLDCSPHLKRFACFLLVPYCGPGGTPLPPCRSLCEKVKSSCAHMSSAHWLVNLNCTQFPTLSRDRLCLGEPLTSMGCVGPQSRPCTVISTTLPIFLKCTSPGIRFAIDEITVFFRNDTRQVLGSTSEILRQCNNQLQSDGIHECRLLINYSDFGIDETFVRSVAVNYHCMSI